ncbi:MAG: MFS transporter [Oscillospiraceae bacterium]|nr:MFS transporter [Oscillospiraceae bacterium]
MNIGERVKKIVGIEGNLRDELLPMLTYNAFSAGQAAGSPLNGFNSLFVTEVEGMSPGFVGVRSLLGGLVDAFVDPFYGIMVDRTRSRWGRHRPYILAGILPWAMLYFMQYHSFGLSQSGNFTAVAWYYIAVSMVMAAVNSFMTMPHVAMLPELAPGYFQRTQFNSMGLLTNGVTMPTMQALLMIFIGLTPMANVPHATWRLLAIISIAIAVPLMTVTPIFTKTPSSIGMQRPAFDFKFMVHEYKQVFRSRSFRQFFVMRYLWMFGWGFFNTAMGRGFFLRETMGAGHLVMLISTVAGAAEMMTFIPNYLLTKKVGKKKMVWFTTPVLFLSFALVLVLRPGWIPLLIIQELFANFGMTGMQWAISNIQPDTTDVDEMITGRRREGAITAVDNLVRTSSAAVLGWFIGTMLEFFGVEGRTPAGNPSPPMFTARATDYFGPFFGSTNAGLRLMRGILPMLFVGGAILALRKFTMTKDDHELIKQLIAEKHEHGFVAPPLQTKVRIEEIAGQKWEDMWIGKVGKPAEMKESVTA